MSEQGTIHFFKGMFYSILGILWMNLFQYIIPYLVENIPYLIRHQNILQSIKLSFGIFFAIFTVIGVIALIIKSFGHMILCFYYFFFYQNKYEKIKLRIDEKEKRIKDCYVEMKNGDKIPIEIYKAVIDTNEEKVEETEDIKKIKR